MGFLDSLLGRSKPKPANLDALFAIPDAALTLQAAAEFRPTGVGSVCFKAAEGAAATAATGEGQALLGRGEQVRDSYGFTWLVVRHDPADVSGLVTDLHAANSTLQDAGFGPLLLCSIVCFADGASSDRFADGASSDRFADGASSDPLADGASPDGARRRLGLVYLYKRGTFYPFAPVGDEKRDTALELQVRGLLSNDLKVEPDLARWFPVWGAPGL